MLKAKADLSLVKVKFFTAHSSVFSGGSSPSLVKELVFINYTLSEVEMSPS